MGLNFSFSGDFDVSFFYRRVSESRIYGQMMITHLGIDSSWFLNLFVAAKYDVGRWKSHISLLLVSTESFVSKIFWPLSPKSHFDEIAVIDTLSLARCFYGEKCRCKCIHQGKDSLSYIFSLSYVIMINVRFHLVFEGTTTSF